MTTAYAAPHANTEWHQETPVTKSRKGLIGLILAVFIPPIGLIISIMGARAAKKAGYPNGLAVSGIAVGAALTLVGIFAIIALGQLFGSCADLGPGVHLVNGMTLTCH